MLKSEYKSEPEDPQHPTKDQPPSKCFTRVRLGLGDRELSFNDAIFRLLYLPKPKDVDLSLPSTQQIKLLIEKCEQLLIKKQRDPSTKELVEAMGRDSALAIIAYTCEKPFPVYAWLNGWLYGDRSQTENMANVGPFFRLFYKGLATMQPEIVHASRSLKVRGVKRLIEIYKRPKTSALHLWAISSFSKDPKVPQEKKFLGENDELAIVYTCHNLKAVSISCLSANPKEDEYIPLPPAKFKLVSTLEFQGAKNIIGLEHEPDNHHLISYVESDFQSPNKKKSSSELLQDDGTPSATDDDDDERFQ